MARSIQWLTFDIGGTLIEPYPSVGKVYATALHRHDTLVDPETVESRFRAAFLELTARTRQRTDENAERAFWREIVRRSFAEDCPADTLDQVFDEVFAHYATGAAWRVYPDTFDCLKELQSLGARMAALSNADARMHQVFRELGLTPYFAHILLSSEMGHEKPDRAIFSKAETVLGATGTAILHTGDSRRHDYDGAKAAGWQALWLCRDRTDLQPQCIPNLMRVVEYYRTHD